MSRAPRRILAMPTKSRSKASKSRYSPHPSLAYAQGVVAGMKAKTGRSLEEWVALVAKRAPDEGARAAWLKEEHGLGTNYAGWIAARSLGKDEEHTDPAAYLRAAEQYVEAQYAGAKAALRPLYEALLERGLALGRDVKACPCKTMVPLFRNHVIAEIKASARTRVDLGLALGKYAKKLPKTLVDTGGAAKKDRITHRIALARPEDLGPEVERWLRVAYELDG
jgi:uncharacterized protein DUF5655/uncharacterized protein DUF4287